VAADFSVRRAANAGIEETAMRSLSLPWVLAVAATAALLSGAEAAERARADISCQPGAKMLQYDCAIKLTNARTGAPLTKVDLTVGADMPSMPMAHNVRPVKATPTEEPGTYRALIELEMYGDWALQLNLVGELYDRVIKIMRFEGERAVQNSPKTPSRHKH
jgi:YtkA-like